ncbi:unnamed protein product [Gulo gulo]|uniref:Uncharacterized protein n=1 Tax=Gulo gulo TaxID=48420 RepID=A0A9X9Q3U0_GULGU|nr:unnamed protein product [Gulo gulo]
MGNFFLRVSEGLKIRYIFCVFLHSYSENKIINLLLWVSKDMPFISLLVVSNITTDGWILLSGEARQSD